MFLGTLFKLNSGKNSCFNNSKYCSINVSKTILEFYEVEVEPCHDMASQVKKIHLLISHLWHEDRRVAR